jgi:hypothetical protein
MGFENNNDERHSANRTKHETCLGDHVHAHGVTRGALESQKHVSACDGDLDLHGRSEITHPHTHNAR